MNILPDIELLPPKAARSAGKLKKRIRLLLTIFIVGLVLSGLTAFPLRVELDLFSSTLGIDSKVAESYAGVRHWLATVAQGLRETYSRYPFMAYGTDWLAFAHLVIAAAFISPLRDPVRNVWVVTFGIIACLGVIPLALIAGAVRGIPLYWRLIDCSFGVFGIIPLFLARRYIAELEKKEAGNGS